MCNICLYHSNHFDDDINGDGGHGANTMSEANSKAPASKPSQASKAPATASAQDRSSPSSSASNPANRISTDARIFRTYLSYVRAKGDMLVDHDQVRIKNFYISGVGNGDVEKNCDISGLDRDLYVGHRHRRGQEGSEDLQSSHVGHLHTVGSEDLQS